MAHEIGHRYADTEGSRDSLKHDKGGPSASVKETCHAEHEGYQQTVNGIGPQIICRRQHHLPVPGEHTSQQISVEK